MTDQRQNQRMKILARLKKARSYGVTNVELSCIAQRFGGRLFELRKQGWRIKTERLGAGLYVYRLHACDW